MNDGGQRRAGRERKGVSEGTQTYLSGPSVN